MTNDTPITQIMGFDVDETTTDMSTFDFKYYLSITVGATGEAGVFFVADGKVKAVDVTNSFDFTWGKTHLTSHTWKVTLRLMLPQWQQSRQLPVLLAPILAFLPLFIPSQLMVEAKAIYHRVTT